MNFNDLEFEKIDKKAWEEATITVFHARIPAQSNLFGVGVDPGRNFGIATLTGKEAWVFVGTLNEMPEKWMYGIAAYDLVANPQRFHGQGKVVVEGPAYKSAYGEATLAHIRFGFLLGFYYAGFEVDMVPPASIRKQALGSGKLGGLEIWPDLPHNGADALACALYASGYTHK